jgi:hypothetical protein
VVAREEVGNGRTAAVALNSEGVLVLASNLVLASSLLGAVGVVELAAGSGRSKAQKELTSCPWGSHRKRRSI